PGERRGEADLHHLLRLGAACRQRQQKRRCSRECPDFDLRLHDFSSSVYSIFGGVALRLPSLRRARRYRLDEAQASVEAPSAAAGRSSAGACPASSSSPRAAWRITARWRRNGSKATKASWGSRRLSSWIG